MERRFAPAWVQSVPSTWSEPFGNVALEAMMRGIAVVSSDCGGLPELVRDGETGFLVPPGDEKALAAALAGQGMRVEATQARGRRPETRPTLRAKRRSRD